MKVIAYGCRPDEREDMVRFAAQYGHEIEIHARPLSLESLPLAQGFEGITMLGVTPVEEPIFAAMEEMGIAFLTTRSIGYNHLDLDAAARHGVRLSNVRYSPYSVANFTVMLLLMLLRKAAHILARTHGMDYSLQGTMGRELQNLTVGVVGTGRIGQAVIENLSGFGCKIVAYDPYQNPALAGRVTYLPLEELLAVSDVITLHAPATGKNRHMVDRAAVASMKEGALLINTARGDLVDTQALVEGIASGKLGGVALDCFEGEGPVVHTDHRSKPIENLDILTLKGFPNTLITPHVAFYTDQAVTDMVRCSLESLHAFEHGLDNPYEIKD